MNNQTPISREERERIVNIAREISNAPWSPQKERWFRAKYPAFADAYTPLFTKCCEEHIDRRMFDFMLDQFSRMDTAESSEQANRNVMLKLTELYVAPHLKDVQPQPQ
jgi:hypothetical protein